MGSIRLTKVQKELVELCHDAAEGLAIDVVWAPDPFCGVTEAFSRAQALSRSGLAGALPAVARMQSATAWDAIQALAGEAGIHPKCGLYATVLAAVQALAGPSKRPVCLCFDSAEPLMDCGAVDLANGERAGFARQWEKVIRICEDVQKAAGVPVRMIAAVYRTGIYIRHGKDGRWVGQPMGRWPLLGYRYRPRVRGWDWTRAGLTVTKPQDRFEYCEEAAEEGGEAGEKKAAIA